MNTPNRRRQSTPPNVARLSPDEQISYLFHQYEGFADWRLSVDDKLKEVGALGAKVGELDRKVNKVESVVERIERNQADNKDLLYQVLIAVKGQQIPGLEVPGLTETQKKQDDKISALEDRMKGHDTLKARISWIMIGTGIGTGVTAYKYWDMVKKLYLLLTHTP